MRLYQRPRQIQNTQVNYDLMMNAKMPSKIAKRPNDGSENIQHRTTSAISVSQGESSKNIETKSAQEHAVSIFFDLEKAYDTTWKYGILKDLFDMGLKGNLPNFISNFLSDRI